MSDERQFEIDDKFLDKLRKLAALRDHNDNQHQAAAAAAKLQELLFKYNLDMSAIAGAQDNTKMYQKWHEFLGHTEWKKKLFYILCDTNFCKALYDPSMSDYMWVVGKPHNKEAVVYLYEYLAKELEYLADFELGIQRLINIVQDKKSKVWAKTWRTSFMYAALPIIHDRLKEQWNQNSHENSQTMALVVTTGKELQDALNEHFPRRGYHSARKLGAIHADGSAAGKRVGAEIPLNRGISSNPSGRKELS
jgi:Protein of unknown function (DUF2786)